MDSARTEFNAQSGMATSRLARALTPEEKSVAEVQAREEAARAAAAEAEHRRPMAMVQSFQTEDDLRRAFGSRVSLNRDAIKTARMGIDGLRQSLVALLQRAGEIELNKRAVPKKLAVDILVQHGQLLGQQSALASLQRESRTIQAQLEEAVVRYRELKPKTVGAPTPAG